MVSSGISQSLPTIPLAVLEYATEHGLTSCLEAVLELTRKIVPTLTLAVFLEEDPELADYQHVVLEAKVPGWKAEELFAARRRWSQALIQECPAPHLAHFLLRLT